MKLRPTLLLILIIIILFIPTLIRKQNNSKIEGIAITPTDMLPSPTLDIIVITETPIPTPTKKTHAHADCQTFPHSGRYA